MITRALLGGLAAAVIASPAIAFHCPKDAAAIDHGIEVLDVSADVKAQAKELRDKGMEQHEAGNHAESVNSLAEAMRLLLNSVE